MPDFFDRVFREKYDNFLPNFLAKTKGIIIQKMEEMKDKQPTTVLIEGDFIKKVISGDGLPDYVLHVEGHWKNEDLRRLLLFKYGLLHYNTGLDVLQIVLYYGPDLPTVIRKTLLELRNLNFEFILIDPREYPKELFINSDKPDEVVIALLCDWGEDKGEAVVRQIIQKLSEICGNEAELGKNLQHLQVLSRLRNLQPQTIQLIKERVKNNL